MGSCQTSRKKDYFYISCVAVVFLAYLYSLAAPTFLEFPYVSTFSASVFELMNKMAVGLVLGVFFVGLLSHVPRELIMAVLGTKGRFTGLLRATAAGLLLDLCSHGILLVGTKLYERGASLGQVIAFLVASPWNSFSITIVLFTLIGLKWTFVIIVLSLVVAIVSGFMFEILVQSGILPKNPNQFDLPKNFRPIVELKRLFKQCRFSIAGLASLLRSGFAESRMILRWIFFGTILASLIRTFVSTDNFQTYFGPTLAGLGLTLLAATVIEVCSEGSAPIASDLLTRARAPGNTFAFLMTGVSTDYTEIMALKETTRSWKIALFLPLITVPQVILLAYLLNNARV